MVELIKEMYLNISISTILQRLYEIIAKDQWTCPRSFTDLMSYSPQSASVIPSNSSDTFVVMTTTEDAIDLLLSFSSMSLDHNVRMAKSAEKLIIQ
jgi:hypothetical protein